ncbi:Required for respiratory growth protein 9, mitochondrial [Exophiala dermatitidis]
MSLNVQTSQRVLWAVVQGSRPSCTSSISRQLHSTARPLIQRPRQSLPGVFVGVQDVHVHKRRRYTSHGSQGAPTPCHVSGNGHTTPAVEETTTSHAPSHNAGERAPVTSTKRQGKERTQRSDKEDTQVGRSSDSVRDRTGRQGNQPDAVKSTKSAAGKGKNKRLQLKDLAISKEKEKEPWQIQKQALKEKFGDAGWNPRKKLSPDTMEGIRALHEQDPERWSTPVLADHFKVSPEAIRRILKSKWRPSEKEMERRRERWARRHDRIWDKMAELGLRPQRTKEKSLEDPDEFEENLKAKEILDNARNA